MPLSRRHALALLSAAALRPRLAFAQSVQPNTPGPFQATLASLQSYRTPAWFADAKFGIWAHWGPQSGVEQGDWFARLMYIPGTAQYEWHLKNYGHPSKTGYKDLVPLFKGAEWDPEHLMDLYQKAGARYFVSMGVHHDNYDMWNSRYQPRWNAMATGPKRDIVGEWRVAARKRGLRFGVSEHLSNSFDWFAPAHLSDTTGPLAGVPYDGTDEAFADLYHDYSDMPADFAQTAKDMGRVAPERWKKQYLRRVQDLVEQHQPDFLYTDGSLPFAEYGYAAVADLYNVSARLHGGRNEAVMLSKGLDECNDGVCTLDRERSVDDLIRPEPWQTDTCIGGWHYKRGIHYKSPKKVVDMLVDIVSKNGNLLLSIPLPNSGVPDAEEMQILAAITAWTQVNGEGIFGTRPWHAYGEGPAYEAAQNKAKARAKMFEFNEGKKPDLTAADIRFTTKGFTLFAFVQGWPAGEVVIRSLGTGAESKAPKITSASLVGSGERLRCSQKADGLHVGLPAQKPGTADLGIGLRLTT